MALGLPLAVGVGAVLLLLFAGGSTTSTTRTVPVLPPKKPVVKKPVAKKPAELPPFSPPEEKKPLPELPVSDKPTSPTEPEIETIPVPGVDGAVPMIDESGKEIGPKVTLQSLFNAAPAGSWIPDRPENWGQTPSLASGFVEGKDVYFVMIKKGSANAVLARMTIEKTGGDENTGPLGEGRLVPLIPSGGSKIVGFARDYEQMGGSEQPVMGSTGAVPISYTIEPPKD
jgi:hypothetical protein